MSISTLLTLFVVLGILWGGFLAALVLAVCKEKRKSLENDIEWKK